MSPTRPGLLAARRDRARTAGRPTRCRRGVPAVEAHRQCRPHATLACKDGNGNAVYGKAIPYTDFPLPEIALYFTDGVILLPGEY